MQNTEIQDIQRIFATRLATFAQIMSLGEKHFAGEGEMAMAAALQARLAPDMFPLGTQIAFACNQPRGFALWCAGQPYENLDPEVKTLAIARSYIQNTLSELAGIEAYDAKLDEIKRTGLGPGHYAILRNLGVPLGKGD